MPAQKQAARNVWLLRQQRFFLGLEQLQYVGIVDVLFEYAIPDHANRRRLDAEISTETTHAMQSRIAERFRIRQPRGRVLNQTDEVRAFFDPNLGEHVLLGEIGKRRCDPILSERVEDKIRVERPRDHIQPERKFTACLERLRPKFAGDVSPLPGRWCRIDDGAVRGRQDR